MDDLRKAQQQGVVLGLKGLTDGTPVARLDIDELVVNKPDTFNLFVLALNVLQDPKKTGDKMGYFQVAGIHGLPTVPWDGVQSQNKTPQGFSWSGYCTHSRPTFPAWHRPYLAMYEQTIYATMADIAEAFPESAKPKYRTALRDFRLPYFDYYKARREGRTVIPGPVRDIVVPFDFGIPQVFTAESLMIRQPKDDQLAPTKNPLWRFDFPKTGGLSAGDWGILTNMQRAVNQGNTVRYPSNVQDANGNPTSLSTKLNIERARGIEYILNMMDYPTFAAFSSNTRTPGPSGNLENIHNNYHGFIGGGGHMGAVPAAAFDPVFWIHHCQIDRLFAIWQAIHPQNWFDGQFRESDDGPLLSVKTLSRELSVPFRNPNGSYWFPDLCQDTKSLGYVYNDAIGPSPTQIRANFQSLYSWAVSTTPTGRPPAKMAPLPVNSAPAFQFTAASMVNNLFQAAAVQAPQVVLNAVKTAAVPVAEATGVSAPHFSKRVVSSTPAAQSSTLQGSTTSASGIAFTNMEKVATPPAKVDISKYNRTWFVDSAVQRLALNGTFTIFFFIGPHDRNDTYNYSLQPTLAGENHIFAAPREACDNCGAQASGGHLITGTNPITTMLREYIAAGELADLEPNNVTPFLIKNLRWRVVTEAGQVINPRAVDGLTIGVSSKLTPQPGTPGDPIYEEYPQVVTQILANAN